MNSENGKIQDLTVRPLEPGIFPIVSLPAAGKEGMMKPHVNQPFVCGLQKTPVGDVPGVSSSLSGKDRWGTVKARWGVGRMNYKVDPGLYALGTPGKDSPVLVTANYKMSFDRLRAALPGRHAWILVLDTDGINVWCAAGKGTFGTEELVQRVRFVRLAEAVSHRQLILPQLSGPGVSAHQVKKLSGFKAIYGPIRAKDLPPFLDDGLKATREMRKKTFTARERAALIPLEFVVALKWAVVILPFFFLLGGLGGDSGFWEDTLNYGLFAVIAILSAVVAGTVLTPILLPWLPGLAFSLKGLTAGVVTAMILVSFRAEAGLTEIVAWFLIIPAITTYLAMDFTGASTYTSLSGVKKEMKWAIPLEIAAGAGGLLLWVGSLLVI